MTSLDWPALSLAEGDALPAVLTCERGVIGKVHGAASDSRWIARSPSFDSDDAQKLYLGTEDKPVKACFWSAAGNRYRAVGSYRSRAVDAAGRLSLLEKQLVTWPAGGWPAALGALALLPLVADFDDDVWWEDRQDPRWSEPDFMLDIDPPAPVRFDRLDLQTAINRGTTALKSAGVNADSLGRLYAQLLAEERPALLAGLVRPLSPEALAVLLLPCDRSRADGLSLAGWLPSKRASFDDLRACWDVLAVSQEHDFLERPEVAPKGELGARARRMASAVLNLEPGELDDLSPAADLRPTEFPTISPVEKTPRQSPAPAADQPAKDRENRLIRPGRLLGLTAPSTEAPRVIQRLFSYADSVDCRRLTPEKLALRDLGQAKPLASEDPNHSVVNSWPQDVETRRPADVAPEQWNVKVELLRAAALVLAPAARRSKAAGSIIALDNKTVPALFFLALLDSKGRERFAQIVLADLTPLIRHSVRRPHATLCEPVIDDLSRWRTSGVGRELTALISQELSATSSGSLNRS